MHIHENQEGDVTVITIQGQLDTVSAPPLEARLLKLIEGGVRRMLIDCAPLDYVNSAGLKVFLLAARELDTKGGKLVLCALSANVRMIFDMIGFTKIMTILPDRDEGLRAFSADGAPA